MIRNPELEKYLSTNNCFDYKTFYDFICNIKGLLRFAEIGVWKGHSISHLARNLNANRIPYELFAIDTWDKNNSYPITVTEFEKENIEKIFDEYTKIQEVDEFIKKINLDAVLASKEFEDNYFDFVMIDLFNDKKDIEDVIKLWWKKIRHGGILACHEFIPYTILFDSISKLLSNHFLTGNYDMDNNVFFIVKD